MVLGGLAVDGPACAACLLLVIGPTGGAAAALLVALGALNATLFGAGAGLGAAAVVALDLGVDLGLAGVYLDAEAAACLVTDLVLGEAGVDPGALLGAAARLGSWGSTLLLLCLFFLIASSAFSGSEHVGYLCPCLPQLEHVTTVILPLPCGFSFSS